MLNSLPFVGPLIEGSYFLEPEELFGMKYALMHEGWPIPLKFYTNFPVIDHPVAGKKYQIIFTGYRPIDTFILHKYFSSMKFYNYNVDPTKAQVSAFTSNMNINKNLEKRPFVGMRPGIASNFLQFESKFENGNLDRVVVLSEKEYDLYVRSDTNAKKRFSWFYFSVSNCKGKGTIRFNVINLTDSRVLYDLGMKPVVSKDKKEWDSFCVENVEYSASKINDYLKVRYGSNYYMLSFEINFNEEDKIWIARSIPYSYSQLLKSLAGFSASGYIKHNQLCKTIGGLHVPKLTITNFEIPKKRKKYVLIAARYNPGETCSSFVIEGIIQFLLSDSTEAQECRNSLIFKLVPMCNPEGVVIGNSRSTVTGMSIHHKHSEFTEIFSTETKYFKKLAYKLQSRLGIYLYLEVAGSFTNFGSFFHNSKNSQRGLLLDYFIEEYLKRNSVISRVVPSGCNLSDSAFPMRRCLERDLRIFTAISEISVFGYKNDKGLFLANDPDILRQHGCILAESVFKHFQLSNQDPNNVLKYAAVSLKSNNLSSSDSESLYSDNEVDPNLSFILKQTLKSKSSNKLYRTQISSDDEDLQSKDHLLESFQDFCLAISNKKYKKIKKYIPIQEKQKILYLDSTIKSNKMVTISKKSNKKNEKIEKLKEKNKSFSLIPINFSKCCTGFKSCSVFKPEIRQPSFVYKVCNKGERTLKNEEIYEMPEKPQFYQSTTKLKPKTSNLPKFSKFGPFPDLNLIKKLKIKAALEL